MMRHGGGGAGGHGGVTEGRTGAATHPVLALLLQLLLLLLRVLLHVLTPQLDEVRRVRVELHAILPVLPVKVTAEVDLEIYFFAASLVITRARCRSMNFV